MDQAYFDNQSATWDENPLHRDRTLRTFETLQKNVSLTSAMDCMDFGCGTGLLSFYVQPLVHSITLVDSSAGMLEKLKEKIHHFHIKNMFPLLIDMETGQRPVDQNYDLIYAQMSLHHVLDIPHILEEFHQLLKPEGYLCIADLEPEDGSFHAHHQDFQGHLGFDPKILAEQAKEQGFSSIEYEHFYTLQRPREKGGIKEYPLFFLTAQR